MSQEPQITTTMNGSESQQLVILQGRMEKTATLVEVMDKKMDRLEFILSGSGRGKDDGIMGRIDRLEAQNEIREKEIEQLREMQKEDGWKTKLMWMLVGGACLALLSGMFNILFKAIVK